MNTLQNDGIETREVPGFPGIYATEDGRVYNERTGRWLKGNPVNRTGHLQINLSYRSDCAAKCPLVHRLVALAFLGEPPSDLHQVDHIDHDARNNAASNLRWVTNRENHWNRRGQIHEMIGVTFEKRSKTNPWVAKAWFNGRLHHIGSFPTPELARAAYLQFLADRGINTPKQSPEQDNPA